MRQLALRLSTAALACASFMIAARAEAEPVVTGRQLYEDARRSIDVVDNHLLVLQARSLYDASLAYFAYTQRWAPVKFRFADGQDRGMNLTRLNLTLGAGIGKPSTWSIFGGADVDEAGGTNPGMTPVKGYTSVAARGVLFIGGALFGVQASYGVIINQMSYPGLGLNNYGDFVSETGSTHLRNGAPSAVQQPPKDASNQRLFSFYEDRSGAYLALVYSNTPQAPIYADNYVLSEVRANLQPLKYYLSQVVEEKVARMIGLPTIGLSILDPLKDYYQEARDFKSSFDNAGQSIGQVKNTASRPVEMPFGSDDVLEGGIRFRIVPQVSPKFMLRRAELGIVTDELMRNRRLLLGVRAVTFTRNGDVNGSVDAFVNFLFTKRPKDPEKFWVPVQGALSYSFNSPDGSTFLPIANAHVFGFQIIVGYPEVTKPLIPLVRAVEKRIQDRDKKNAPTTEPVAAPTTEPVAAPPSQTEQYP